MTSSAARAINVPVRLISRRARLMLGCALAGVTAMAAHPQAAAAQSADHGGAFEGFITSATPDVHRNITSSTTETIVLGQSKATINWSPYDNSGSGNIDFLPQGHVVTFTNEVDVSDFTVLNRIVPGTSGRAIELNGKVIGQIQSQAGTVTGGHIWFYSPGGIIIGSTAIFDVGGLLLTTNDPGANWDANATGFSGAFNAASGSMAKIVINPGAQINATPQNSYIAVIAPRIEQHGTINVNGSAALVAGERLTMTMDQGLFDIQVDIGTSDAKGIVHTGTTGGAASTAADDYHRIYLVAVPKNQALTMVLSGKIGFAPATSASLENGQIILSAGSNIADSGAGFTATQAGGASAEIDIGAGTYSSDVAAIASGDIDVLAGTGAIAFAGDVTLNSLGGIGDGNVTLGASNGHALTIGGDLLM
ncbi:MAG: histidine kinase, partial [Sphingomicrobium sp.]